MVEVKVDMPDLGKALESALRRTTDEVLINIEDVAKRSAPVDTGFYRNNIKANLLTDEVVAKANYSAALEYGVTGTARQPRPTMRNAARSAAKQVPAIFRKNFGNV